jgi:hypothetical protein
MANLDVYFFLHQVPSIHGSLIISEIFVKIKKTFLNEERIYNCSRIDAADAIPDFISLNSKL